jgi:nitrous oxidase accessory protein
LRKCLSLCIVTLITTSAAGSGVLEVCPNCPLRTLEQALPRAKPGDTILLAPGHYPKTHVVITVPVTILGTGRPVLDGGSQGTIITVQCGNVHLHGMKFANTGYSSLEEYAAIKLENAPGCTIGDIETENCAFGIACYHSPGTTIENATCRGTGAVESLSGNGVHLWKSPGCSIERCTVSNHRDGLYFEFSSGCRIEGNESSYNMRYGLHFMFSDSNIYRGNVFHHNGAGVAVMYSRFVRMESNAFRDNWGPSSYGLLLKDISGSIVCGNVFEQNTAGIYMEGSDNTSVVSNTFRSNGWALKLFGSSVGVHLAKNTFIANTFDVLSNASQSSVVCRENYWDHYRGYDLDRDGYGDTPYRPVSLFSILIERVPTAILLLRSFIVELLAYMERAIPSMIPPTIEDGRPRMKPYPSAAHATMPGINSRRPQRCDDIN